MFDKAYDLIILGAGPAGLQAAIYAVRRRISVLVIGKTEKSSASRAHIENFCCFEGQSGAEMLEIARGKAESHGAAFLDEEVMAFDADKEFYYVEIESGQIIKTHTLILATGVSRNKLGLAGEIGLVGRGVSYCVDCDGPLFRDEPVAVVGCGSAAVSGALTLRHYTKEINLICQALDVGDHLAGSLRNSDVVVHEGRKVTQLIGKDCLEGILLDDGTELRINGIFIEQGAKGAVDLAGGLGVMLDETMKYIAVNKKQETNIAGLYAAGDLCGPPWQVAKALGEGCVAGLEAAAYARKRKE